MLPVCSATHSQLSILGGLRSSSSSTSSCLNTLEVKSSLVERAAEAAAAVEVDLRQISFKTQSLSFNSGRFSCSMDIISRFSYHNELSYTKNLLGNYCLHPTLMSLEDEVDGKGTGEMRYIEGAGASKDQQFVDLVNQMKDDTSSSPESFGVQLPPIQILDDGIGDNPPLVSESLTIDSDSLSGSNASGGDSLADIIKTISETVNNGESALNASLSRASTSLSSALDAAKETVNDTIGKVLSSVDKSGDLADRQLAGFSSDLKEASGRIGITAVDLLRRGIVVVEDSLVQGASAVVYAYGSVKELLPPDIQEALKLSEEKVTIVLRPLGTTFQQAYIALEELEKGLGIDPNDPIVTFVLFLGASITLWLSFWVLTYGGYSGDLSAKSTLELLTGKENAVLIDVRPEDLRDRDGIPDLRRIARFRYASVAPLPEVDSSIRKLLKGGKDLDDTLIAVVIQNLKNVKDSSKVIVMDADGTRSKGIARSLRKLGIKRPYLLHGGYRSWVEEGLRVKELKPETALTILNEEAEAILEEIKPTPFQLLGYGAGILVAVYAIVEWENTLQFVGVLGLGQTIFRRFASYEGAEDFKQDLRLLLAPVRLGSQAVSIAAARLEPSRNGLPTSPSSTDVQNRVLQAAAKHESQPSDDGGVQDPYPASNVPVNEKADLSEA